MNISIRYSWCVLVQIDVAAAEMSDRGPFSYTKVRFNPPSYEDSKKKRRDMGRFGYRKITLVAPWKVEEKGQIRGRGSFN